MAQNRDQSDWEIDGNLDDVNSRPDADTGTFLVKVFQMEKKTTRNEGKPYFNLGFKVIDVLTPEKEASIGASLWDLFNVNQEALWKLKALIKACGYDASGSRIPNLTGCELILEAYLDTYNKDNPQIRTRKYQNVTEKGWSGIAEVRGTDGTSSQTPSGGKTPAKAQAKPSNGSSHKHSLSSGDDGDIEI